MRAQQQQESIASMVTDTARLQNMANAIRGDAGRCECR